MLQFSDPQHLVFQSLLYFLSLPEQVTKYVRVAESEGKGKHSIGVGLAKDGNQIGGRDSIQHESEDAARVASTRH